MFVVLGLVNFLYYYRIVSLTTVEVEGRGHIWLKK